MKTNSIKTERSLMIGAAVAFIATFAFGVLMHNQSLHQIKDDTAHTIIEEVNEPEIQLEAWMLDASAWDKNLPAALEPIMPTMEVSEAHFILIENRLVNILAEVDEEPIELESWMLNTKKLKKAQGI